MFIKRKKVFGKMHFFLNCKHISKFELFAWTKIDLFNLIIVGIVSYRNNNFRIVKKKITKKM